MFKIVEVSFRYSKQLVEAAIDSEITGPQQWVTEARADLEFIFFAVFINSCLYPEIFQRINQCVHVRDYSGLASACSRDKEYESMSYKHTQENAKHCVRLLSVTGSSLSLIHI